MDIFWDKFSIKRVTMTTFGGETQDFGTIGPASRDTITFKKDESLIGIWGFLGPDKNMIGLGALVDKCEKEG